MDYQSSIDNLSDVKKKISVVIPLEYFKDEAKKALGVLAQKVTIKGFRPGKAPQQIIEKMYGERARLDTVDRLINESFQAILKENGFSLVGDPAIEIKNIELSKPLEYSATVSIFPKPEVGSYDHFKVTVEKREATDKEVEQFVQDILRSKATLKKVEDRTVVVDRDVVEGELRVHVEGNNEEGRPEPFFVKIGDKRIPEVLETGMLGMEVGEIKQINTKIGDDHQNEEMRGKTISYTVEVKGISEEILPDLNDEFVKTLEGPEETVLELKMSARQKIDKEYENMTREQVKGKIIE
ncbi:MAG: trigger factor, partial [SAR324 cluster bacterium]|nr:trigger factor [SAR324 cluster bacterium]